MGAPDEPPQLPEQALSQLDPGRFKLLELMVLAIAERGGPMTYEEIQLRLLRLRLPVTILSLQRAWHGLPPLRKNADGALELVVDLDPMYWRALVEKVGMHLGILHPRPRSTPEPPPPVDDVTPVTPQELGRALKSGKPFTLTLPRLVGLIVEAAGEPLQAEQVRKRCHELGESYGVEHIGVRAFSPSSPPRLLPDGRIGLDPSVPSHATGRRIVREVLRRLDQEELAQRRSAAGMERYRAEREEAIQRWQRASKRFLCTFWQGDELIAASVLDPARREIAAVEGQDALREQLHGIDALLALDPRAELEHLGIQPDDMELVDLRPSMKTRKLNRAGRVLKVTLDMVVRSTLNHSERLGDRKKMAAWAKQGRLDKVHRRLASDVKTLYALHEYGELHGHLRLRWGFLDEAVPLRGDFMRRRVLYERCKEAMAHQVPVDLVLHGPPGWSDPWSRAQRCLVLGVGYVSLRVLRIEDGAELNLRMVDVYAFREVEKRANEAARVE